MRRYLAVAAMVACFAAPAAAQYSDAQLQEAIKIGQTGKSRRLVSSCVATSAFMDLSQWNGSYDVAILNGLGRVASLAEEAKQKYLGFPLSNVDDELRTPAIYLIAAPHKPKFTSGKWHLTAPSSHAVLKSKDNEDQVLQPEKFTTSPVSWSNAFGAEFQGTQVVAQFSFDGFGAFPKGDVDIVLITDAGERRCKVGQKDRQMLMQ